MRLLTQSDLTRIFNVSYAAVSEIVSSGKLPYQKIVDDNMLFSPDIIIRCIEKPATMNDEKYLERLKKKLWELNPAAMRAIEEFGSHFSDPAIPKRFYLETVKNKKMGFVYYVRYLDNGVLVPSHWCTHTNIKEMAEKFAIENRERLLANYFNRDKVTKPYGELYAILRKYYSKNSPYLEIDAMRGRAISDKSRIVYNNMITKQFIPYLKKNGIKEIEAIDTPLLSKFQMLLFKGTDKKKAIKPQTINHYISHISTIFDHLIQEGNIKINPCKSLICLKVNEEQIRGCYVVTKLKGVFNKRWSDEFSYLLCLVIYTTGMRNSEIERMKVNDLITIGDTNFIDIPKSKTKSGIRTIPLHDFAYRKIMAYIRKTGKKENDLIFNNGTRQRIGSDTYEKANLALAEFTGYSAEKLENENITFYSGRHFWKTLMNGENLGEVEELFMGHKVTSDVAERYNHRDKQGRKKLLERAKRVFQILDKHVFRA